MSDSEGSGVVGYFGDEHGRPNEKGNEHLTPEQREELTRRAEERAERRGRLQALVVVRVFESGEADPQVTFPKESTIDIMDREQVNDAVAKAAVALQNWR
jgi:hypothetical protein